MGTQNRLRRPLLATAFVLALALLPGAPSATPIKDAARELVSVTGRVLLPDGSPARGAVVVSSAGGSAAVGADGSFALALKVDPAGVAVELTAVANGHQGALIARRRIDVLRGGSARDAGTFFLAASGGCVPEWIPTFGGTLGPNGRVFALAVYDDGSGPALYAGGGFTSADGAAAGAIARYDGHAWSGVGGGVSTGGIGGDADVYALAVYDDGLGGGPALYVGGRFLSAGGVAAGGIARWDGQSWSGLDGGVGSFSDGVEALAVFDDGGGPALFVGGGFTSAGGIPASNIAKWDGAGWSAVGSGVAGLSGASCSALTVFDDGAGPALYAGGNFTSAGGQSANRIAKWDGQGWSPLGSGVGGGGFASPTVRALCVFDDGSGGGPALYAGGQFADADGLVAHSIARWDGQGWSGLAMGAGGGGVDCMVVFDDGSGSGPGLFVGGTVEAIAGATQLIAKWDGQGWSEVPGLPLAGSLDDLHALAVYDDGTGAGPALIAGGLFTSGYPGADHIVAWDGQEWSGLGSTEASGLNGEVHALAVYDDGSGGGPALYVGGLFTAAGGQTVNYIARWDGQAWSPLGAGVGGFGFPGVNALAVYDDGSGGGPALYAGGTFTTAGGHNARRIARWDGQAWTALAGGIVGDGTNASVNALAVYDDGSGGGAGLYVGGNFNKAGPLTAYSIAKWQGLAWSPVGAGIGGPGSVSVYAMTVYDDGSGAGPALYVGGSFGSFGLNNIARWNGQWKPLGQGVFWDVYALCVYDDGSGSGPALMVAGSISAAGGQPVKNIARWNGQSWSDVGGGMSGSGFLDSVISLAVHDDGSGKGPALYAGGWFTIAGGQRANHIARWDGQEWSALGSGLDDQVRALIEFDDGSGAGPALFAGGMFADTPMGDSYLARWGCPAIGTLPGCSGNPAALTSLSEERSIGSTLVVSLSSNQLSTGLGLLYFGLEGADAAGCGLFVPGIGELLLALAPTPQQLGSGALAGGDVTFALPLPDEPSLVGVDVALQGVAVGVFEPGVPLELSNALLVTITL